MKLLITKFIKNPTYTNQYKPENYFTGDGIDVVDYLTIEKIPPDGIPIFNEELTKPGEPMQLKCGDFDVTLSLLDETKSNLGKSIAEFFLLDKKYIIRLMVENNGTLKSFGFIDVSSINFDYNLSSAAGRNEKGYTVSFTVYSGELEWHNFVTGKKFSDFGYINQGRHGTWDENDLTFGEFMGYFLNDTNLVTDNRTNIESIVQQKCGFIPKTSPLQKAFVNETYWQIFKDIMIGFGITYKIVPNETYCHVDQWGKPNIILFFRSNGIDINELKIIERTDSLSVNSNYETFMMLFSRFKNSPGAYAKYEGFMDNLDSRTEGGIYCFNIDDVFNVSDGWDIKFFKNGVQEYMFRDKTCVTNAGLKLVSWSYDDFGKWGDGNDEKSNASSARFFVESYSYTKPPGVAYYLYNDNSFDRICSAILPHVYDFVVTSLKRALLLKIVNEDLFDTSVYNKANFNSTEYWIEKVYDVDLKEHTAKVKMIEV